MRSEERSPGRIKDVHAHVIGIRPGGDLWIIEEVRTQVIVVPKIRSGRVTGSRNRNAFISRHAHAGELTDDPAIRKLIVKYDWVATTVVLADATKTAPQRRDP